MTAPNHTPAAAAAVIVRLGALIPDAVTWGYLLDAHTVTLTLAGRHGNALTAAGDIADQHGLARRFDNHDRAKRTWTGHITVDDTPVPVRVEWIDHTYGQGDAEFAHAASSPQPSPAA